MSSLQLLLRLVELFLLLGNVLEKVVFQSILNADPLFGVEGQQTAQQIFRIAIESFSAIAGIITC